MQRGTARSPVAMERNIDPSWWQYIPDLQLDIDMHAVMSKLGMLDLWWSPAGERTQHDELTRQRTRAERRAHNSACLDEELARQAEREPSLCSGWRGRRKWLVNTRTTWVVNIHWATSCKNGECVQRHLNASSEAYILHLSRPGDAVWTAMPGGGSSWDVVAMRPPTPPSLPRSAEGSLEGRLHCTSASYVWLTVGRSDGTAPLFGAAPPFCHEHLVLPGQWMGQFPKSRRSFWRNKWLLVHEYLQAHPTLRLAVLSDA